LARSNTRTIGFTIAQQADQAFSNPFLPEFMRGMSAVAQARDYDILLSISRTPEEEREKCLKLIKARRVDGLIVSTSRVNDPLLALLIEENVPFVLIGRCAESPVLSVNNDNVQAARSATRHLLDQGYEKVAFVSGDPQLVVSVDRLNGYKQALIERDLPVVAERITVADFSIQSGFEALKQLKERGVEFDAVMAADDLFALGALRFAKHYGLRVPEDLGIVGFNDSPLMSFIDPPLTSVKILAYELGVEAMELLLSALEQPDKAKTKKEILIASELIVRRSSMRSGNT
jgi:DNA-binding LacI/PurR family transcriptional regulator